MIAFILRHKTIFGFFVLLFFVLVVSTIISLLQTPKQTSSTQQTSQNQQSGNNPQTETVAGNIIISPNSQSPLHPGSTPTITVSFPSQVSTDNLTITLTRFDMTTNSPGVAVPFTKQLTGNNKILSLTFSQAVLPLQSYNLSIISNSDNSVLAQASYSSDDATPTPLLTNNKQLAQYLPHNTSSYTLTYDPNQNVYVFSFIFDDTSDTPLQTQFNQAKQQALSFIQSKGIDPQSVTVEWNYH